LSRPTGTLFKLRATDGDDLDGNIPILPAWDTGKHYAVWCQYCVVWHRHSREDGDRAAHCDTPSPYKETGYVVRCVGAAPKLIRQDLQLSVRTPRGVVVASDAPAALLPEEKKEVRSVI